MLEIYTKNVFVFYEICVQVLLHVAPDILVATDSTNVGLNAMLISGRNLYHYGTSENGSRGSPGRKLNCRRPCV